MKTIRSLVMMSAIASMFWSLAADAAGRTPETVWAEAEATTNSQQRLEYFRTVTTDEWRAMADLVLSVTSTNAAAGKELWHRAGDMLGYCMFHENRTIAPGAAALAAEYDSKFAAAGYCQGVRRYETAPALAENWLALPDQSNVVARCPVWVATVRKLRRGEYFVSKSPACTFAEFLNLHAELSALGERYYNSTLGDAKNLALRNAPRHVKRAMREQGKSFVAGPEGENPVQEALDGLSAALNAPKFAGLSDWVARWYPDHEWHEPAWLAPADLQQLEDDVYYGEKDLEPRNRMILEAHLGVEAYNAFVDRYNGTVED